MDAKERREIRHMLIREMLSTLTRRVTMRVWRIVWLMDERGYTANDARKKTERVDEQGSSRHTLKLYGLRRNLLLKSRGDMT